MYYLQKRLLDKKWTVICIVNSNKPNVIPQLHKIDEVLGVRNIYTVKSGTWLKENGYMM